VVDLFDGA
jgi:hypothetical protein